MDMVFIYFNFQQITGYRNKYRTMYINVYQKNNYQKKILLKSIDLINISLKRVQQFFFPIDGVCQKITEQFVVHQTLNHVHFRAYTGITIYICQSRICLKLAQEWNVLSDILVNFVKNAHEYIDQYMRAFFKFCYTTWVFP